MVEVGAGRGSPVLDAGVVMGLGMQALGILFLCKDEQ